MGQILIIEDNADISMLYQRALFGHQHVIAPSAEEAVQKLETDRFDLIILDMHLPGQDGLTVLKHIRQTAEDHETPVFAISADDLYRIQCEDLGIQAWMTKPIEVDVLMETARRILEAKTSPKR